MLYVQQWSLKNGLHKDMAQQFILDNWAYPGVELIGRYHSCASLEGWIILRTDDPKAIFVYAAKWANILNWKITPVFEDQDALPMNSSVYEENYD